MDKLAAHSFEVVGTVLMRVIGEWNSRSERRRVIVVDKPAGWTSHDVVNRMRGIAGTRRVDIWVRSIRWPPEFFR